MTWVALVLVLLTAQQKPVLLQDRLGPYATYEACIDRLAEMMTDLQNEDMLTVVDGRCVGQGDEDADKNDA